MRRGQFHIRLVMAGVGTLLGLTRALWQADDAGAGSASAGARSMLVGVIRCPPPLLSQSSGDPAQCEPE